MDGNGIPLAVVIDGANVHDMCLTGETLLTLDDLTIKRPNPRKHPQGLCMDKGYDYPIIREVAAAFGFRPHIQCRGEEIQRKRRSRRYRPRRWVVERTHSWMNAFRSLKIRWLKKEENFVGLMHMAFAILVGNQIGLFG